LRGGRRYKKRKIGAKKRESCNDPEGGGPCGIIQIVEIPHITGEGEDFHSSPIIEDSFTIPFVSPRSEITIEDLSKSLIARKRGQSSRNQRSGISA
jgi:hypothetical protein